MSTAEHFDGGCVCRYVRYRMLTKPMFVHCCHCRWCQRETGAAFALNATIEADRVQLLQGAVESVDTPSNSGKGQKIARCPTSRVSVWSHYAGGGLTDQTRRAFDKPARGLLPMHPINAARFALRENRRAPRRAPWESTPRHSRWPDSFAAGPGIQ